MYCQSERQKKMDTCDEDWKDGSIESILIEKGFSTQAFLKKQDEIRTLLNSPPKPNFKLTSSVSSHKIPSSLTSTSSIDQVLLNFNQTFTSVTTQPITSTSTSLNQTSSPMSISPNLDLITHRNLTQLNRPDRLHQSDRTPTLERQPSPTLSNLKPHNQATLDHHPRAIISLHTHNHLHRLPPAYSLPSLPIHSLSNHSHKTNQPIPFDLNLKTTDSLTSPLMSSNTLSSDDDFSSPQPDFSTSDTSSPRSTPAALYLQPPTLHSARSNQRSVRTLDSILTCKMKKTLDYLPPFDKASDHPTTTNTISSCFNSNLDHSFSNSQPTSTATTTATAATTTTTTTPAFTPFSSSNSQLNHIINLSPNADLCTRNNPHDLSSSSSSTTIPPSSEALLDQCKRSGPTHTPSLHTHPPSSSSSSPLSPLSPSSSSSSHPHHQSKPRARSVEIESGLQSKHPQQKRARDTSSPPAHASHHTFSNLLSSPILRSFRDDQNPSTAHPIPLSSPARPCLTPRYTLSLDTDSNSKAVPAEAQPRSSSPSDLAGPQTRLPYASNARSDTLSAGRLTSPSPPFQLSSPSPSCTSPQADPPTYPPITSPASRRSFQLSDPPEPKSTVARLLHFPSAPAQSSPPTQSQSRTHHLTKVSAYHTSPRPLPSPLTSLRSPSLAHRTPHSHPISEQCPTFSPALLSSSSSYPEFNLNPNGSSNPNEKPTYSYAALIGQAIMCSESKKSCLNDIYAYIMNNYSYYRKEEAGWQNSIRHNLSLNESFVKVPRGPNEPGKGSFWAIAPGAEDQFANGGFKKKSNSSNPEPSRRSKATGTSRRRGKPNSNNEDPPSGSGPSPVSAPPLGSLQIGYPPNSLHGHHSPRSIFASRPYPHLAPPRSAGPHHRNPVDLMTAAMSHRRSRLDPPKIYTRPDLQPSTTHSASRSDPHARIRDEPSRGPAHGIERSPTLARQDRFTTHRLTSPLVIPHHQYLSSTKRSRADEDGDGDGDDARPQRQHSFLLSSPSISSASAVPSRPSLEEEFRNSRPVLDESDTTFGYPQASPSSAGPSRGALRLASSPNSSPRVNNRAQPYRLPQLPSFRSATYHRGGPHRDNLPDEHGADNLTLAPLRVEKIPPQTPDEHRKSPLRLTSLNDILATPGSASSASSPFRLAMGPSPKLLPPLSSYRSTYTAPTAASRGSLPYFGTPAGRFAHSSPPPLERKCMDEVEDEDWKLRIGGSRVDEVSEGLDRLSRGKGLRDCEFEEKDEEEGGEEGEEGEEGGEGGEEEEGEEGGEEEEEEEEDQLEGGSTGVILHQGKKDEHKLARTDTEQEEEKVKVGSYAS